MSVIASFFVDLREDDHHVCTQHHLPPGDIEVYEDLLSRQVALFVEEELSGHFAPLITFVRGTEAEVHALGMGSRPAGDGGPPREVSLPDGIVPRVDQVVVVSSPASLSTSISCLLLSSSFAA